MSVREMSLKFRVPFIHTIDLMLVASLARALRKVSLSPFAEASGDVLFEVFLTNFNFRSFHCSKVYIVLTRAG